MFDLGMPPHGGFAIGLERLTAQVLNLPNVRQAVQYPRDRYRVAP
jgi:nondiscriminating aspartyl-tRNA synthetase